MPIAQLRASVARRRASGAMTSEAVAPAHLADAGTLGPAAFWAAFAALFLVAALPVLSVELPPLFDYPNHLARMDLLSRLPASEALQRYYEVRWRIIPNLGMDLMVPTLARVMPLAWAGKTFILASLATYYADRQDNPNLPPLHGSALWIRVIAGGGLGVLIWILQSRVPRE